MPTTADELLADKVWAGNVQPIGSPVLAPSVDAPDQHSPRNRTAMLFWAGALAATIPMLAVYLNGLWKVEHYQFFPLVFAFVIGLAASRFDGQFNLPRGTLAYVVISFALILIAFSAAIFSPWFTAVGFVLIVACLLATLKESSGQSLVVLVLPLVSLVRLPLNFDNLLITGLQGYTSRLASWFLDIAAVPHMVSGNIIELVDRDLFVAEACSGIQSVFTLVFLSSMILAYRRRPLWLAPGYWAVALLIAVLGNSFRVATISAAASLGVDWATGMSHAWVGYVALAISFMLLISFDQCIDLVIHPIEGFVLEADNWTNPLIRRWDRYVIGACGQTAKPNAPVGPAMNSLDVAEPALSVEVHSQSLTQRNPAVDSATAGEGYVNPALHLNKKNTSISYWIITTAAILLLPFSLYVAIDQSLAENAKSPSVRSNQFFQPSDDVIAVLSSPATVLSHEVVRDAQNPRLGDAADVWTIGTANWQGQLVLSQPYTHWHDLCVCYRNLEWQLNDRLIISPVAGNSQAAPRSGNQAGYVLATFQQGITSRGYLLFSAITYDADVVTPPTVLGPTSQLINRFAMRESGETGDMMMLQLWIESPEQLGPDDTEIARKIFVEARDRLVADVQLKASM